MIPRLRYLDAINKALSRSKITVLLGPRQCGKTTLAREIAKSKASVFLDMESPLDRSKLQNPEMYLESLSGLIIIDEIQQMPELFPVLRVLADRSGKNGRFLILGSASPHLIKNASESLAGRVEFVDLHGFDILETQSTDFQKLWLRGGFPLSYLTESDENSSAWREGFVRTFLERDIPLLGINIPSTTLRRFWTMLAHSHGQILNSSQLANSMGLNNKTIRSYIDILNATYMIRILQPWHTNLKKRQVKSPKIYFTDSGLHHHLLGIQSENHLLSHPQLGSSWEGFALEQILRLMNQPSPFFWSTYSGAELDLLLTFEGKNIGFEFKYSEAPKPTKSMYSALSDLQLDKLLVIYPGKERYPIHDRIEVTPLYSFIESLK
jgi:predicted AAA+ superfamily ATPase